MPVEGEAFPNPEPPHYDKARAVSETVLLVLSLDKKLPGISFVILRYPDVSI